MANYKSDYTGEEIDAGIAKANTAMQLNVLQREIDVTNPLEYDLEHSTPTQAVLLDILANKYMFIHIYNVPINENLNAETYLICNNMANATNENNLRYYFKFDEGDEGEGIAPNIEQYIISMEDNQAQMEIVNYNLGGYLASSIGDLSNLTTTDKTSLVGAINELVSRVMALELTIGGE